MEVGGVLIPGPGIVVRLGGVLVLGLVLGLLIVVIVHLTAVVPHPLLLLWLLLIIALVVMVLLRMVRMLTWLLIAAYFLCRLLS